MPKSTIGYYAVRIGCKSGIYMNWEECKEQIHQYPGALYKKFYTKQQAEDYINEENYDETNILKDDDSRNLSERLPEKVDNEQDLIVLNDLLKEQKGKSIFKHVRGHSGVYENKQADRLAYLDFQKTDVKEFNFPKYKQTIKEFLKQ
ncbi:9014_t:CDS:2 [Gigaspora margarita]|uniref:ribonuclease H n=1 Tax=Gigaspora margarita TaxID=4874 RepID=A0ABN7VKJ3_GIGMA|nr:9014_t:CDS:2 [Gigaspora margarita]